MECKANLEFNLPAQEVDFNVAVAWFRFGFVHS